MNINTQKNETTLKEMTSRQFEIFNKFILSSDKELFSYTSQIKNVKDKNNAISNIAKLKNESVALLDLIKSDFDPKFPFHLSRIRYKELVSKLSHLLAKIKRNYNDLQRISG